MTTTNLRRRLARLEQTRKATTLHVPMVLITHVGADASGSITCAGRSWAQAEGESVEQLSRRPLRDLGAREGQTAIHLPDNGRDRPGETREVFAYRRTIVVDRVSEEPAPPPIVEPPERLQERSGNEAAAPVATGQKIAPEPAAEPQAIRRRSLVCPVSGRRESIAEAFARARSPFR